LRLGFIALNDCAPLVVAKEKGFFAAEGLEVELQREPSWANIRDKLSAGEVQGAHMLASMALASTMGSGSEPKAMIMPLALNHNGSALTVSTAVHQALAGRPLRTLVKERAAQGLPPLRFAVVFPYSIHNYLLRDWLAAEGVDPEREVRITVTPPARMAEQLKAGAMDGFCVGEPWNAMAEAEGTGVILWRAADIRPGAPDKVLAVAPEWAEAEPETLAALIRALVAAQEWADVPTNRRELAELLAQPGYVGAPADLIEASLEGMVFAAAGRPKLEHGLWFLGQMQRWGQVPPLASPGPLAEKVYRADLYDAALANRRP
jgi:NitT/TauT family transport system ATP-binding protein/nitrate/nitrite transport system substrate-binding protein